MQILKSPHRQLKIFCFVVLSASVLTQFIIAILAFFGMYQFIAHIVGIVCFLLFSIILNASQFLEFRGMQSVGKQEKYELYLKTLKANVVFCFSALLTVILLIILFCLARQFIVLIFYVPLIAQASFISFFRLYDFNKSKKSGKIFCSTTKL
jgi:hypothetical protein